MHVYIPPQKKPHRIANPTMSPKVLAKYHTKIHIRPVRELNMMSTLIGPMMSPNTPAITRPTALRPVAIDSTPDAFVGLRPRAVQ